MNLLRGTFESYTTALSVGSLCLFGIFLMLDRHTAVYSIVSEYSGSAVWAVVATIPVVVITYAFGFMAISLSEVVFDKLLRRRHEDQECFIRLSLLGNDVLMRHYLGFMERQRFLEACTFGLLVLGFGCCYNAFLNELYSHVGYWVGAGCIVLGTTLSVGVMRIAPRRRDFAELALRMAETTLEEDERDQ